jgi:hypothetical protein
MSYRTCVEGSQIFGNNEYYPEWIEFIKSQGIEVDDEQCYEGEIHDFMGALVTIEKIVMRLHKEKEELRQKLGGTIGKKKIYGLFDFTHIVDNIAMNNQVDESGKRMFEYGDSLFDELYGVVNSSYSFMPYAFFTACEDKVESLDAYSTKDHFHCYKIKDGQTIHVKAN